MIITKERVRNMLKGYALEISSRNTNHPICLLPPSSLINTVDPMPLIINILSYDTMLSDIERIKQCVNGFGQSLIDVGMSPEEIDDFISNPALITKKIDDLNTLINYGVINKNAADIITLLQLFLRVTSNEQLLKDVKRAGFIGTN